MDPYLAPMARPPHGTDGTGVSQHLTDTEGQLVLLLALDLDSAVAYQLLPREAQQSQVCHELLVPCGVVGGPYPSLLLLEEESDGRPVPLALSRGNGPGEPHSLNIVQQRCGRGWRSFLALHACAKGEGLRALSEGRLPRRYFFNGKEVPQPGGP
jgi:hypothetical protein